MAERGYQLGPVLTDKIISVVRRVESMPYSSGRTEIPTRFDSDMPVSLRRIKHGWYQGNQGWAIGETKVVNVPIPGAFPAGSADTFTVHNYCIEANPAEIDVPLNVLFCDTGGTHVAIAIEEYTQITSTCTMVVGGFDLTKLPNYDANSIQMLGHGGGGTNSTACQKLQWYSVLTCTGTTTA
jgi:hypothetical protein